MDNSGYLAVHVVLAFVCLVSLVRMLTLNPAWVGRIYWPALTFVIIATAYNVWVIIRLLPVQEAR